MKPASEWVRRALDAWNRFWFRRVETHTLSLVRVFFGLALLLRSTDVYGLYRINALSPELPRYEYDGGEMYGAFTMPWRWFEWIPSPDLWLYNRIDEVTLVLLVLFTVGLFTRFVGVLLSAIFAYVLLASQMNYYHHVWCYTLVLPILAFSRCNDHYSLDAYFRGPSVAAARAPILPLRLLQVMVSLLYLSTFLSKCNEGWLSGRIMYLFHESESIEGLFHRQVLGLIGYQGLSVFTVLAEGFLAFALWVPRLRMPAIAAGVVLHMGIDAVMAQRTFSYQMIALYIAFLAPAAGCTVILHHGRHQQLGRLANLLDWLRRLSWLDVRREEVRARLPADVRALAEHRTCVITPEGRVRTGFEALRSVLLRLPVTFFPGLLLCVPGAGQLARTLRRMKERAPAVQLESEPAWQRSIEQLHAPRSVEEFSR